MVFDFFYRYLFSSKASSLIKNISWLSVIGLSISVTSLVVVISIMTALNHNIEDRTLAVEPHLTASVMGVKSATLLEAHPVVSKLREDPSLRVSVYEEQDVILRTLDGQFKGALARGMMPESLDRFLFEIEKLKDKEFAKKNDLPNPLVPVENLGPQEILIGIDLAISLGVFEGDSLMVVPPEALLLPVTETPKFERVTIKRIISTNLAAIDGQNIYYNRENTLGSFSQSQSRQTLIEVWMPKAFLASELKEQLAGFSDVRVSTWKEKNSALFLALRLEKTAITLFLSLAAILAGFSLVSVLLLLVSQKKKEIALLQAIGLSQLKVRDLFFKIGLCLAAMGILSGLILGSGLSFWLEKYPLNILPDIYYDSEIPAYLDGSFVFIVFFVAFAIAALGSFLSSREAARISPAQALSKR